MQVFVTTAMVLLRYTSLVMLVLTILTFSKGETIQSKLYKTVAFIELFTHRVRFQYISSSNLDRG